MRQMTLGKLVAVIFKFWRKYITNILNILSFYVDGQMFYAVIRIGCESMPCVPHIVFLRVKLNMIYIFYSFIQPSDVHGNVKITKSMWSVCGSSFILECRKLLNSIASGAS